MAWGDNLRLLYDRSDDNSGPSKNDVALIIICHYNKLWYMLYMYVVLLQMESRCNCDFMLRVFWILFKWGGDLYLKSWNTIKCFWLDCQWWFDIECAFGMLL